MKKIGTSPECTLTVRNKSTHVANSPAEVFSSPNPHFGLLAKQSDRARLKEELYGIVKFYLELIWPNDNVNSTAVLFADDLIDTRPDWKINDIDLFMKFIRRNQGQEGMKQFHRPNIVYLSSLLPLYEDYKSQEREKKYQSQKENKSDVHNPASYNPKYLEAIKKVLEENKPVKEFKPVVRVADDMFQRWMRKFDEINRKKPVIINGTPSRFIFRYGRKMNIDEYLSYKQDQYNRLHENTK